MIKTDRLAIIADDYTGAGDAGVHFARFGRRIELLLNLDALAARMTDDEGDVALSSETRFAAPEEAAAIIVGLVEQCHEAGLGSIFKKIDSTMRGNPGAEIAAVLAATGHAGALVCPAMPKTGRTCVDGSIFVDGTPLHLSDIGADPFHPLTTSSVVELIRAQTDLPIACLGIADIEADPAALGARIAALLADGVRLIVADAVEDRHLTALAQQIANSELLAVGAGGFAEACAEMLAPSGAERGGETEIALSRPIVAIVGSMAEASRRQAEDAERSGRFVAIEIGAQTGFAEIDALCTERVATLSAARPNVLVRVAPAERGHKMYKTDGERVAERLGHAAASICRSIPCSTVVSTGGSTSMAVARALGIQSVDLIDEILPGIVAGACHCGETGVEWFVSKAGGFGKDDLLTELDARCAESKDDPASAKSGTLPPRARHVDKMR